MTNFSTNQVMQFYGPQTVQMLTVKDLGDGKKQLIGNGVSSDVIENVEYIDNKSVAELGTNLVETLISCTASGKAQEYIVRVSYPSIAGAGEEAWTTKTVSAFGNLSDTICSDLVEELNKAFDADGLLEATDGGDGTFYIAQKINIDNYVRGTHPILPINYTVSFNTIIDEEGNEVDWASKSTQEGSTIPGVYKLMDLEYFAMGERGDQYRGAGWPDVIPTKYEVAVTDSDKNVLHIHYSYKGANQNSHKSEKDLFLVGTTAKISALESSLSPSKAEE